MDSERIEKFRGRLRKAQLKDGLYYWPDGRLVPPWFFELTGYSLPERQAEAFYAANSDVKSPYDQKPGFKIVRGGGGLAGAKLDKQRRRALARRRKWKGE